MSGITSKHTGLLLFLLVIFPLLSDGQTQEKTRSVKLILGGGLGHFFNSFTNVSDEDVHNDRPSFCGKLLWQPEHRLSIGLESGYYFMYSTTRIQTDSGSEKLTSRLKVVPLFLSLSMNVIKNLDLNFGTGWAEMIYTVNPAQSKAEKVVGTTYSMSNYTTGFTYSHQLGKRLRLGAEFKYLYLRKTNDSHASLLLNISYKIFNWKI